MEAALQYARGHWVGLAAATAGVVVTMYLTRRYTVPALLWLIEFVIYAGIVHVVLYGVVAVTAWFRYESQMKMLVEEKVRSGWRIPLQRFWDRELYIPFWLFYVELALLLAIICLMIRYKPMQIQKPLPKRERLVKGKTPKSVSGLGKDKSGRFPRR